MIQASPDHVLMPLRSTDLTLDIRGQRVITRQGDETGHALFVDPQRRAVRRLHVGAGGFPRLGERHFMVPVETVARVAPDGVQVDQTRERAVNSPRSGPDLTVQPDRDFWEPYSGSYGSAPFWGAGSPPPPLY